MKVRFAPSPTGRIHVGNARTALMNACLALRAGGDFLLRFDDTDTARSTKEFAEGIERDLRWLGIEPDRTARQSERQGSHESAASALRRAGLLYACYETPDELERRRKRLLARGSAPIYDRAALRITDEERKEYEKEGRTAHWRFLLPNFEKSPFETRRTEVSWDDLFLGEQTVDIASMSDPVLVRADGTYLYTLPSVVDDADLGITHVVRGSDHVTNTAAQIALFEALGRDVPRFGHHNLLAAPDGGPLSKRLGSISIEDLRSDGFEPEAVTAMALLTGTSSPVRAASLQEQAAVFDPLIVSHSPARFDPGELASVNERWVHQLEYADVRDRLLDMEADCGEPAWLWMRPNCAKLQDAVTWAAIVRGEAGDASSDAELLAVARNCLPIDFTDPWAKWISAIKERTDRKGRALFMPLRLALTGLDHGPELGPLLPILGRQETLRRLS